jgi:hypothetical protein
MSTVLNDVLPSNVLVLHPNGDNFTIFSLRFLTAVDAKGYMGHFDGTNVRPVFSAPVTQPEADELERWDRAERNSKALLKHKMPDSIAVMINSMASVSMMWKHINDTFTTKGACTPRPIFVRNFCSPGVPLVGMFGISLMRSPFAARLWLLWMSSLARTTFVLSSLPAFRNTSPTSLQPNSLRLG